jgi:hypothetical protein
MAASMEQMAMTSQIVGVRGKSISRASSDTVETSNPAHEAKANSFVFTLATRSTAGE